MGLYAEHIFPWAMDRCDGPAMAERRARALATAAGEVLEIGLGTGLSLRHYPPAVRALTAVEPAGGLHRRAVRRAAESGLALELVPVAGEHLPFPDHRFDTVVILLVLCTAADVGAVLAEAHRVLRPGGRYCFLEHVVSPEPRVQAWQRRLNALNRRLACGCELTRDTERRIHASGFAVESLERAAGHGVERLHPTICGVARKPA